MYDIVCMMEEVGLLPMPDKPPVICHDEEWCAMAAEAERDFPDIMKWYEDERVIDFQLAKCKQMITDRFRVNELTKALNRKMERECTRRCSDAGVIKDKEWLKCSEKSAKGA